MLKPDFAYSAIWLDLANRHIGMGSHLQGWIGKVDTAAPKISTTTKRPRPHCANWAYHCNQGIGDDLYQILVYARSLIEG
jgi:hypothetical protein